MNIILSAMRVWSWATCLQFVQRSSQHDYVYFRQGDDCSSSVGRIGGRQYISLDNGCLTQGIILHEIGHAIGLWHEHTRPDRNAYITVHYNRSARDNFETRREHSVDFQGTDYDYGSIMHYSRFAFFNCPVCYTISINNNATYTSQGRPTLGQRNGLSSIDITQVRRLYKCPGEGQRGFLVLYLRYGINLGNGGEDPYVRVTAVDNNGNEHTHETSSKSNTRNPEWKEWMFFSDRDWQFFRMRVWDYDSDSLDDAISMSQTIPLLGNSRRSSWNTYCANTACTQYVHYDYKLITPIYGTLQVKVRYARYLPDTDGSNNLPDPYVRIKARKTDGTVVSKRTNDISGTTHPDWNEWLNMGCNTFFGFTVQIFDDDYSDGTDKMSELDFIEVFAGYHNLRLCLTSSCNSYLYLDYDHLCRLRKEFA
jgi:hypothetical protein